MPPTMAFSASPPARVRDERKIVSRHDGHMNYTSATQRTFASEGVFTASGEAWALTAGPFMTERVAPYKLFPPARQ
jgi:hypothetical protein